MRVDWIREDMATEWEKAEGPSAVLIWRDPQTMKMVNVEKAGP